MKEKLSKHKIKIWILLGIFTLITSFCLLVRFNLIYIESYVKKFAEVEHISIWKKESRDYEPIFKIHDAYGFMDKEGNVIQKPFASRIENFNENGIALYQDHITKKWGFVKRDGTIMQQATMKDVAAYEDLLGYWQELNNVHFRKAPSLYRYRDSKTKKIGLIDGNGEVVAPPELEMIKRIGTEHMVFPYSIKQSNNEVLFGIMDMNGKIIKEPFAYDIEFEQSSRENYYSIGTYQLEKEGKKGLIDGTGKIISEPFAYEIEIEDFWFTALKKVAKYQEEKDGLYGLVNQKGEIIKKPFAAKIGNIKGKIGTYLEIEDLNLKYGLINIETGKIIHEPFASDIFINKNGIISTFFDETEQFAGLINTETGEIVNQFEASNIQEMTSDSDVIIFRRLKNGYGIVNSEGAISENSFYQMGWGNERLSYSSNEIKKTYQDIFNENGIGVFNNGNINGAGLFNYKGEIVRKVYADKIYPFSSERAVFSVYKEFDDISLYGVIDLKGNVIKEAFAKKISSFTEGIALFEMDLIGIIDKQGEIIKEPFAYSANLLSNGFVTFSLEEDGKVGLLNSKGEIIYEPFANRIEQINPQLKIYKYQEDEDGLYGLLDEQGNILREPFAKSIQAIEDEDGKLLMTVYESPEILYGILNKDGTELRAPFAWRIAPVSSILDEPVMIYRSEIENHELVYGLIDLEGNMMTKPFAEKIYNFSTEGKALFTYKQNGLLKYGIVDITGNISY